jgi:hypothetical protein
METLNIQDVLQRNRALNFPRYDIAIPIEGCEEKVGKNFSAIMAKVREMSDTFGLCGVLSMHVNGLLTNPQNWMDVQYDPIELKRMFDKWSISQEGESAFTWFDRSYKNRLTDGPNDFAVVEHSKLDSILTILSEYNSTVFSANDWQNALTFNKQQATSNKQQATSNKQQATSNKQQATSNKQQATNNIVTKNNGLVLIDTHSFEEILNASGQYDGMAVAVLCEYPVQKGTHTHWLSAKPTIDQNQILISGDLKPFGIDALSINVPTGDVLNAMTNVIGTSPTTALTTVLAQHEQNEQGRNLHNEKIFLSNLVRRAF